MSKILNSRFVLLCVEVSFQSRVAISYSTMSGKENMIQSNEYEEPAFERVSHAAGWILGGLGIALCGTCYSPLKSINQGMYGVVMKFGRLRSVVGAGLHWINPVTEVIRPVDVRTTILDLPAQTVVTKDNMSIRIDGVVYYTIFDIKKALFNLQDVQDSVFQLALVALRTVFGTKQLQECLEQREEIAEEIESLVVDKAAEWGVKINMIQITDIILPQELRMILSSVVKAKCVGDAKIISAQAEVDAAKLIKEAAEILGTDAAMQIRVLESYQKVSNTPNQKIIFLPLDGLNTGYTNNPTEG